MYPVAPASLILFVKRISAILLLVIDRKCSLCAGTCFDWWKQTIGLVDGCLVGQNPIHHPTIIWKRGTAL